MIDPAQTDMLQYDARQYVEAAAPLLGLALSPEQLASVSAAFALIIRFGAPALQAPLDPHTEPAPVFGP